MDDDESLSHTKWECQYHVVFIPKCRRKTLYGELRKYVGEVFRKLAKNLDTLALHGGTPARRPGNARHCGAHLPASSCAPSEHLEGRPIQTSAKSRLTIAEKGINAFVYA